MSFAIGSDPLPPIVTDAVWGHVWLFFGASTSTPRAFADGSLFDLTLTPQGRRKPAGSAVYRLSSADGELTFEDNTVTALATVHADWDPGPYLASLRDVTDPTAPVGLVLQTVEIARGQTLVSELGGGGVVPLPSLGSTQVFQDADQTRVVLGDSASLAALAQAGAVRAEAAADDAEADAAATAADRVQTGLDRTQTTADAASTAADRVQTGLDRLATGADAGATAVDRVQTGEDRTQTTADAVATAADRVQTGLDRLATGADADATAADRVQTGLDRVATGADAAATATDRVQTGLDRAAAAASAATATTKAAEAEASADALAAYPSLSTDLTGAEPAIFYTDEDGFKWPLAVAKPPTDVVVSVFQSNAEGRGTTGEASPSTLQYYISGSTISFPLADPVGGALNASMWPALANEWLARTGRRLAVVDQATGGSAVLAAANPSSNWSPTGSLRAAAVAAANAAVAAINASPDHTLGNVYICGVGGEQEAESINGTTITAALFEQGLEDLAAYFAANIPGFAEMWIVRAGSRNDRASAANWAAIRAAQEAACTDSPHLRMVYRGTFSFAFDGRQLMEDSVHWNRTALNLTGKCAAREAAKSIPSAIPAAPALLASAAYGDSSATAATSRTQAHTTAVGTKMLVLAIGLGRTTANSVNSFTSVTFNGVAMTKAKTPNSGAAGANASPAGRADVAIYYLTETAYGASLSGLSANVVVTPALNTNIISLAAYDLDQEAIQSACYNSLLTSATGTNFNISVTTGAPALLIGVIGTIASSAAALTTTFTGLTEVLDAGGSDGTKSGQVASGYAAVGEVTASAVSAVVSGTCNAGAFIVAAFRGKIDGE